jgi:hypothetical protein
MVLELPHREKRSIRREWLAAILAIRRTIRRPVRFVRFGRLLGQQFPARDFVAFGHQLGAMFGTARADGGITGAVKDQVHAIGAFKAGQRALIYGFGRRIVHVGFSF